MIAKTNKSSDERARRSGKSGGTPRGNRKWSWHYRTLLSLRERLLREKSGKLEEASSPVESHGMSIADRATDEFDHNLAFSGLTANRNSLYEIDEAVKRIENGTYGTCLETGNPIPAARLRAVPWARFCRDVEARLENAGAVSRPSLGAATPLARVDIELDETESLQEEKLEPAPADEVLQPLTIEASAPALRRKHKPQPSRREAVTTAKKDEKTILC
jgi:RNA polymerase-binding protein DksA